MKQIEEEPRRGSLIALDSLADLLSESILHNRDSVETRLGELTSRLDHIDNSLDSLKQAVEDFSTLPKKLCTRELASFYGVSEKTVTRWIDQGLVAPHRGRRGSRYWLLDDILRWDEKHRDR